MHEFHRPGVHHPAFHPEREDAKQAGKEPHCLGGKYLGASGIEVRVEEEKISRGGKVREDVPKRVIFLLVLKGEKDGAIQHEYFRWGDELGKKCPTFWRVGWEMEAARACR